MNISDVEQLEERLRQAMLDSDVVELDALISKRLVFVSLDGSNLDKKADLEARHMGILRMSKMEPSDRHVELLGEVALVNVVMDIAGTYSGTPFAGLFRYTRVWHREGEVAQVVAGQVCAIQIPPA